MVLFLILWKLLFADVAAPYLPVQAVCRFRGLLLQQYFAVIDNGQLMA
jgi:hypothetical protein